MSITNTQKPDHVKYTYCTAQSYAVRENLKKTLETPSCGCVAESAADGDLNMACESHAAQFWLVCLGLWVVWRWALPQK
jgi:hypothetical protein